MTAKAAPAAMAYTSDEAAFRERYPDPISNGQRPAGISSLMVHEVFDKSQQAEDPISTTFWLVNKKKEHFRLDRGGIERALKSVGFAPSSAGDARLAAMLRFTHDGDYRVMEGPLLPRVDAPAEQRAMVDPPAIKALGKGRYRVTFHVFFKSSIARFHGQDNRSLSSVIVEVGKGSLSLEQKTIWSSFGTQK